MKNCIKTFLSSCKTCIKFAPSQARPPVIGTALSAAKLPRNDLGIDLFDALGKKWLAVGCRYSGYAWLSQLRKTATASVLESLENLFLEYGYPSSSIHVGICRILQTQENLPLTDLSIQSQIQWPGRSSGKKPKILGHWLVTHKPSVDLRVSFILS